MVGDEAELSDEEQLNVKKPKIVTFAKTIALDAKQQQAYDRPGQNAKLNKLQTLLSRAQAYSKFLADRLKEQIQPIHSTEKRQRGSGKGTFNQPKMLNGTLRTYQLEGVQWLVSLFENGLNGILADEMGLGKTVQCIGLLSFLKEQSVAGPFLIVAPLSTLANWMSELQRFAPHLSAIMYHGSAVERDALRKNYFKGGKLGDKYEVVVMSYEISMRDGRYLAPISWKYLIIDEGHRLKNLNCRLLRELKALKSDNRLLITGTPLQNNLTELWSLLNFLLPEIFTDVDDFLSWFDIESTDGDALIDTQMVAQLHSILKPLLLRRLKSDVEAELPRKREYTLSAKLTPLQRKYYQAVTEGKIKELLQPTTKAIEKKPKKRVNYTEPSDSIDSEQESMGESSFEQEELLEGDYDNLQDSKIDRSTADGAVKKKHSAAWTATRGLQNKIMQLRKVCNHPYLFCYPTHPDDPTRPLVNNDVIRKSGKMRLLDQLLTELRCRKHKVLLFSQMSRMLDILGDYLELRGFSFSRIDGSVSQPERQAEIQRFNNDPKCGVFLLSTRAGGLGLNLVAADTNPQMDLQAQDRVHRIGQTKPVLIFRLSTANTAESRMLACAASKRRLERLVIHKKKFKGRQQLLVTDETLLAEDLTEILKEEKSALQVDGGEKDQLSTKELNELLDRSDSTFERVEWNNSTIQIEREEPVGRLGYKG